jgi:hypothetical protein
VKHSPGLRWLIVILLPLTIAWKAAIRPENPDETKDAIVDFLTKQQFDVTISDESIEYMAVIDASSRSCHLRVARVSALGHEANLVRQAGAASDRIFYVFRGSVYPRQPVRLTVASYLWFRFLRELGLVSRIPPVLAVISSCDAEQLPWSTLGSQEPI